MQRPQNKSKFPVRTNTGIIFDPFKLLSVKIVKPKLPFRKKHQSKVNDQNTNTSNIQQTKEKTQKVLGLTKRIKKSSTIKKNSISISSLIQNQQIRSPLELYKITIQDKTFNCFPDRLLIIPQQLRGLNLQHKQDNDCDSDWDQVQAGAQRLFRSLKERLLEKI